MLPKKAISWALAYLRTIAYHAVLVVRPWTYTVGKSFYEHHALRRRVRVTIVNNIEYKPHRYSILPLTRAYTSQSTPGYIEHEPTRDSLQASQVKFITWKFDESEVRCEAGSGSRRAYTVSRLGHVHIEMPEIYMKTVDKRLYRRTPKRKSYPYSQYHSLYCLAQGRSTINHLD